MEEIQGGILDRAPKEIFTGTSEQIFIRFSSKSQNNRPFLFKVVNILSYFPILRRIFIGIPILPVTTLVVHHSKLSVVTTLAHTEYLVFLLNYKFLCVLRKCVQGFIYWMSMDNAQRNLQQTKKADATYHGLECQVAVFVFQIHCFWRQSHFVNLCI